MSNRTQYENDLAALKTALTEMGQSAADAVEAAMEALCTADAEAAAAVAQGDGRINNMERDIEHRCMTLLLRQQPVAGDLRRISTTMKVVTDVERIGDHAADIAEIIPHLVTVRKEGDPAVSQAIAMGKKDNAIFLDTATLEYEYAPIHLENAKIVIACSNKKRGLGDSKYNERRSECETALAELQQVVKIKTLGDLDEETFEKFKAIIKSDVRRKRAKHAVYENQRTVRAVEALKNNDVKLFGELMNASHVSLRDDYEVTGIELDTLVEEAWKVDGVIGSRMTGAGFGGCTVSIVKDEAIDTFIDQVGKAYKEKIGYAADFYVVEIGDGPQTL